MTQSLIFLTEGQSGRMVLYFFVFCDGALCFEIMAARRELQQSSGQECGLVGRASDLHAAEAGSIPRCDKEFFPQSQLSVQTLLRCPRSPRVQ